MVIAGAGLGGAAANAAIHAYRAYTYRHRAAPFLAGAAGLYNMYKRKRRGSTARSYKRRRTARQTARMPKRSAGILTTQHDYKQSRTKRRISKKQRRHIKFVQKVDSAISENRGLISLIETSLADQVLSVGVAPQNYGAQKQLIIPSFGISTVGGFRLGLYTSTGGASGVRKLIEELVDHGREVVRKDTAGPPYTSSAPIFKNLNDQEFYLRACSANVAFRNLYAIPLYFDIYECVSKCDINPSTYITAQGCWDALLSTVDQSNATSGSGAKTYVTARADDSGSTPYTCPEFGKYWKILKKTRTQIPAGGVINYSYSGYKGKVKYSEDFPSDKLKAGKVKDLICILCPTFNPFAVGDNATEVLEWQVTKNYWINWKDAPGKNIQFAIKYLID